jgi:HD-GYP domain-containing protein (c-di-GMP phosphodiesterase class II)
MAKSPKRLSKRSSSPHRGMSTARADRQFAELNRIGIALSETRDVDQLLELILAKAREITGADAGSLYVVEDQDRSPSGQSGANSQDARELRFKLAQNDSIDFPCSDHVLLITEGSIAGYCALHGEAVELADAHRVPTGRPFHFNASFDQESGYRTRSLLALPMKNGKGEILGVLQLINCKRNPKARLTSPAAVSRSVHAFPKRAVELGLSLASQAAVAYENSRLYRNIENLFDGFVKASVKAIEQRDPTTSGHSQRVSEMTLALATVVDREPSGPYSAVRFSSEQLKELRYAALLHDFGKVGVREEILVKAKKLHPLQFFRLLDRFDYIRRDIEARTAQQKVDALLNLSRKEATARLAALDAQATHLLAEVDRYVEFVGRTNEPTILPSGDFGLLSEIARKTYRDAGGKDRPYLTVEEVRFLSIARGSLDPDERRQIESHVVHSFNFLTQIPWTREFQGVPTIARSHHEKLNGKGYPSGLTGIEIPVQAKMMTICDIYDALTASDRPYKRAVPTDRALEILEHCVRDEEIDGDLFRMFVEARVFAVVGKPA